MTITNPKGYESGDFEGRAWVSSFTAGSTIPMGKSIRSVVIGFVDPFFKERSSLHKSRVQLKIGFEIGTFKKLRKGVKMIMPMEDWKEKGHEQVEYYLKEIEEVRN